VHIDRLDMDPSLEEAGHQQEQLGTAAEDTIAAVVQQDTVEEDTVLQVHMALDTLVPLVPCRPIHQLPIRNFREMSSIVKIKQESLAIARTTARCTQYMGALRSLRVLTTHPATFPEICTGLFF